MQLCADEILRILYLQDIPLICKCIHHLLKLEGPHCGHITQKRLMNLQSVTEHLQQQSQQQSQTVRLPESKPCSMRSGTVDFSDHCTLESPKVWGQRLWTQSFTICKVHSPLLRRWERRESVWRIWKTQERLQLPREEFEVSIYMIWLGHVESLLKLLKYGCVCRKQGIVLASTRLWFLLFQVLWSGNSKSYDSRGESDNQCQRVACHAEVWANINEHVDITCWYPFKTWALVLHLARSKSTATKERSHWHSLTANAPSSPTKQLLNTSDDNHNVGFSLDSHHKMVISVCTQLELQAF